MRPALGPDSGDDSRAVPFALAAALLSSFSSPAAAATMGSAQIDGFITAGAIALAVATSLWAAALIGVAQKMRRQLQRISAPVRASIAARDALLTSSRDAVVVWNS